MSIIAPPLKFTPARKAIALASLRGGATIQQAATDAGVSRSTIQQHVAWGRSPTADDNERAFTAAFDAARAGEHLQPLAEDDVVRLLEGAARRGSVAAQKVLLARFAEARGGSANGADASPPATASDDPFAELERGDELAPRRQSRTGKARQ